MKKDDDERKLLMIHEREGKDLEGEEAKRVNKSKA